ncbi:MAG: polysaccharide biosynthesis protein [Pseudonocardia sp.]
MPALLSRSVLLGAFDGVGWMLALVAAALLRLSGDLTRLGLVQLLVVCTCAVAVHTGLAALSRHWRGRQLVGSIDDAVHVAAITIATGLVLFVVGLTPVLSGPRTLPIIAMLVALPLLLGPRVTLRLSREFRDRPDAGSASRVLVFGAGRAGQQIVRAMLSDAESGYLPVGLLDDDPTWHGRRISGVPVRGTRVDLVDVADDTGATLLVVACELDVEVMREISRTATGSGVRVKVVPGLAELFRPWVGLSDLRDLDIADLIGRRPADVDVTAIAGYLAGRSVLVTGAGGSIGAELTRHVLRYGPARLHMLDRDESALHALQLSIRGEAQLSNPEVVLADIRDAETITRLFDELRPDVVFHAAALKHLTALERYPYEAWQTNVLGTANVLDAARRSGVQRFVNISTDKAANPISVLGYSKRVGERLVAGAAGRADRGTYLSVRFGNVVGSRGSVLTTFSEQIAAGGPLTVTHPDVTRFFMTIPEAVRLVIQAAAIGRPGEALVLDMGEPVRIDDIARQLCTLAARSVEIRYTGLQDGEKLHEELFGEGERDLRPAHPAVSHVHVPSLDAREVRRPVTAHAAAGLMARLAGPGPDQVPGIEPTRLPVGRRADRRPTLAPPPEPLRVAARDAASRSGRE